jgi:hypothetical protein
MKKGCPRTAQWILVAVKEVTLQRLAEKDSVASFHIWHRGM